MIKELKKKLEESEEFRSLSKDAYLANVFIMIGQHGGEVSEWQFGYYTKGDNMLTPFEVGENVNKGKADKVFKEPGSEVEELDISKVELGVKKAIEKAKEAAKDIRILPVKYICILQCKDGRVHWNITLVGMQLNTVNVKIDAISGDVFHCEEVKLFDKM